MTIEELKSLRIEVQAELDHHDRLCMSTWSETCLLELIDSEIDRQTMGGWIPVSERAPDKGTFNIVARSINETLYTDFASYERLGWFNVSNIALNDVTHWMPMPEPPERGDE